MNKPALSGFTVILGDPLLAGCATLDKSPAARPARPMKPPQTAAPKAIMFSYGFRIYYEIHGTSQ